MGAPFDMYRGLPKQTPGLLTRDLRLASRHTSPLSAPKRRPGTTSGAPGESHNFVAVLLPLYVRVRLAQKLFLKIRRDYLDMGSFPETVAADW